MFFLEKSIKADVELKLRETLRTEMLQIGADQFFGHYFIFKCGQLMLHRRLIIEAKIDYISRTSTFVPQNGRS